MKKITKISVILITVLVILVIIFWGRFVGSYTVFKMVSQFTSSINNGSPQLNMRLSGSWGTSEKPDSLKAFVQYQKDKFFLADIRVNKNKFLIHSKNNQTNVEIPHKDILVSGAGTELTNFDIPLLIGEIFGNHPQLEPILSLNWFKRFGISAVAFFKCDFRKDLYQDEEYQIVDFPEDILKKEFSLWRKTGENNDLRIVAGDNPDLITFEISFAETSPVEKQIELQSEQKIEVARSELNTAIYRGAVRAAGIMLENMMVPKTDGIERTWGKGKLTYVDGNRVLIAKGTHREIGEAHGALLKPEVRKMIDATLYTICWVYTMERKQWFIDDMRDAYKRLEPFIPQKYQEEMAGLAETSGISLEEIRLTNVFPALFHCSGFALWGKATAGGKLYHGRILDYMTGLGLQYHAVVYVLQPDGSNGFANIGYAGFIGSVSGMNDQQVAIGEMGGRGEGDWDGMPMAFLVREGLEKANTLDEALTIFRDTPRTCEYFYVISDGKIPDARGLATSPSRFEIVEPNVPHPLLPHAIEDAVLLSAGDRYENLAKRVKENYGTIDGQKAIRLMDRPVAMKSDLHNVLFIPESLEFWVANAGANTPACNEPYFHYNLKELLELVE
ncbi:hypothetical protein ISS22_02535 [candidate division KSB1 bacterium]|nr:hypothetical protein [candidate division KSB1 bacterium]